MWIPTTISSLALSWTAILAFATTAANALSSSSIADLLSMEQYAAQARRAEVERTLMMRNGKHPSPLLEPDFSTKANSMKDRKSIVDKKTTTTRSGAVGGGGFGTSSPKQWSKYASLAVLQKERLLEDGVLRINGALSPERCSALRAHIVQEITDTAAMYQESLLETSNAIFRPEDYYGIEPGRSCRTDLLLSLLPIPVSDALDELFDAKNGKLRSLFESLVTQEGILYEMAAVVTSKGSERQCVHPDLPFQDTAPLYVVFLALQNVTPCMGPTTFLLNSNTRAARNAYDNADNDLMAMNELLASSDIRESTMSMGDLVVFDARTMHCGNANVGGDHGESPDRVLFNFSFRNPLVTGSLGYKGSMRPQYTSKGITMKDVLSVVDGKKNRSADAMSAPFWQYRDGLV